LNNSLLHEDIPEPKIAALIYLTENKNAAIKQKDTPAPRLFIRNTPFIINRLSMVYFKEIKVAFAKPINISKKVYV